jgi:alkyl hydroperoxide reductase subunit AhpF
MSERLNWGVKGARIPADKSHRIPILTRTMKATRPMEANIYDLVVIRSGPAGQKAALNAATIRNRVAIVEGNADRLFR